MQPNETYNIPGVPQVRVCPHKEPHRDDFHCHFPCVDYQKHKVDRLNVFRDWVDFLIEGEEHAVNQYDEQNESVEPGINWHDLNNLVSKRIGDREAAQGYCGVVFLRITLIRTVIIIRQLRHGLLNGSHRLRAVLAQGESGDLDWKREVRNCLE